MDGAPAPALRRLTAASLALVLVVLVASAAIRLSHQELGELLPLVRGVHRISASTAALLILVAAWLAWRGRRRALALAVVLLTLGLSVLGALTGTSPPPAAQAGNLLGGLALAAMLAWLLSPHPSSRRMPIFIALLALQAVLGAWLSIFAEELWSLPLIAHATLGIALVAGVVWLSSFKNIPVVVLAIALPITGIAAALLGQPLAASLAHAAAAALLITAVAWAHGRFA